MKTRRLIELLQAADPSGDLDCCVDNLDIFTLSVEPGYYDGHAQQLIRDESNPYYNVVGARIVGRGQKVLIRTLSIEDALVDNPDLPVHYETSNEQQQAKWARQIEEWRNG